jgi:DNA-binding winged helix-turn-helix (wHTH) protein
MEEKTRYLYGFGPFRLDAREYLLLLHDKPVRLPPKAFGALLILVENAGHLVEKNELMKRSGLTHLLRRAILPSTSPC